MTSAMEQYCMCCALNVDGALECEHFDEFLHSEDWKCKHHVKGEVRRLNYAEENNT